MRTRTAGSAESIEAATQYHVPHCELGGRVRRIDRPRSGLRLSGDIRAQERTYDRQQLVMRQLQLLREGRLLKAPGVVYARMSDLDAQAAELEHKIAERRARPRRA
jgi:hypothetical protein